MTRQEAVALNAEKLSLKRELGFYSCFQRDDSVEQTKKINARLAEIEKQLKEFYR